MRSSPDGAAGPEQAPWAWEPGLPGARGFLSWRLGTMGRGLGRARTPSQGAVRGGGLGAARCRGGLRLGSRASLGPPRSRGPAADRSGSFLAIANAVAKLSWNPGPGVGLAAPRPAAGGMWTPQSSRGARQRPAARPSLIAGVRPPEGRERPTRETESPPTSGLRGGAGNGAAFPPVKRRTGKRRGRKRRLFTECDPGRGPRRGRDGRARPPDPGGCPRKGAPEELGAWLGTLGTDRRSGARRSGACGTGPGRKEPCRGRDPRSLAVPRGGRGESTGRHPEPEGSGPPPAAMERPRRVTGRRSGPGRACGGQVKSQWEPLSTHPQGQKPGTERVAVTPR